MHSHRDNGTTFASESKIRFCKSLLLPLPILPSVVGVDVDKKLIEALNTHEERKVHQHVEALKCSVIVGETGSLV